MPYKSLKISIFFLLLVFLTTAGFGCKFVSQDVQQATKPIELTYWRTADGPGAFTDVINAYRQLHPNIKIKLEEKRAEEYEKDLLSAWAEGKGPDIFSIPSTMMGGFKEKILPLPDKITVPYTEIVGTIKKEKQTVLKTTPSLSLKDLKNQYVDVVYNDVVLETVIDRENKKNQIYGLPLSVDSLALFYNKDLLNNMRFPQPPKTWTEFQEMVKKMTLLDRTDNILQAGAALGTAENVAYSADILALLMMQNGSSMAQGSLATFNQPSPLDITYYPAHDALIFYTDFANQGKEVYAWNSTMPNSLDAFDEGNTAFFFGYSSDIPLIKTRAPKLNFGIAAMPQIEGSLTEMSYANYYVETVFKNTKYPNEAWDFVQFISSANQAGKYLAKANKPTALRSLIAGQLEDFDLGVFAQQALIAKSWYHGQDYGVVEKVFKEMIGQANAGLVGIREIVDTGVNKVNQTLH